MSHDDESRYTEKQQRQAQHIEEAYERNGIASVEAESRAWATVNKHSGGGRRSGSARAPASIAASALKKTTTAKMAAKRPAKHAARAAATAHRPA